MPLRSLCLPAAILALSLSGANAQTASTTPREFLGVWAADLAQCAETGESSPYKVEPRFISGYEHGWTIRRWTLSKGVWIGRGAANDDQGSTPATVRLRIGRDGKLNFNGSDYVRCPAKRRAGG
jgi:hypothetical protein